MATAASGIAAGGLSVNVNPGSSSPRSNSACSCSPSISPSSTSCYSPSGRDARWGPICKSSSHNSSSNSVNLASERSLCAHRLGGGSHLARGATATLCSRAYSFIRRIRLDTFLPSTPLQRIQRGRTVLRVPSASTDVEAQVDGTAASPVVAVTDEGSGSKSEETQFISDVANLIKLVDSRDIVELELKHKDYEITIRKKEALEASQPPPQPFPPAMVSSPVIQPAYPVPPASVAAPYVQPAAPAAEVASTPAPAEPAAPAPAAAPSSPKRVICSPMAGTFYRSPAPGEPAFVKVGDTVKKGQPVCIVEAMKLMNEIEADQAGTIIEMLVDDGKPVAVDTPLFALKQ